MAAEFTRRGFAKAGLATTLGLAAGATEKTSDASALANTADSGGVRQNREAVNQPMTGADVLARQLQAHGIPFVSTLCGNGLDPFFAGCKRHGLRLVDVRNEQAAGYMADAVGRLTRRVGVCSASSGVAHVNALTGLTNAHFDGSVDFSEVLNERVDFDPFLSCSIFVELNMGDLGRRVGASRDYQ